jgi:NTP pyrophosphatase (non-canonical NTP hydrolase)
MSDIKEVEQALLKFRKDRNWEQFHNPKDMAISLSLEAAELLEHFQWKNNKEMLAYAKSHKHEIGEELADVFNWIVLLSHDLKLDIVETSLKKITNNAKKYPVNKALGTHKKYTEL